MNQAGGRQSLIRHTHICIRALKQVTLNDLCRVILNVGA
jgi:hypothetical protein